jgi:proteasome lid subunit RPN8/RPN11
MMIHCPKHVVAETLNHLQEAGKRQCECVVLWLGRVRDGVRSVEKAYRPLHFAGADIFRIPPQGMTELQALLRRERLMVAAQVHSHPKEAFHSLADDRWAIVRHEGALSLVVPDFSLHTNVDNFLQECKVFRFSDSARWNEVHQKEVERSCLRIS